MRLTAVILSKTDSQLLFEMTCKCIDSLIVSEAEISIEVLLIESVKNYRDFGFEYPDFVTVITPDEKFNFHRFLNYGIKAASGDFVALCNNDLIFHHGWFSEILKVAEKQKEILSFSPSGMQHQAADGSFLIGHRAMIHIMGWCIVVRKAIFDTIGPLDETFDFYYADNDYGMTLRYHNLKHALVYNSFVEHLERKTEQKVPDAKQEEQVFVEKYHIPKYLNDPKYNWVFNSERYLSGILNYHNKWGSPGWLYRKNKIADILLRYRLGFLNRFFLKING